MANEIIVSLTVQVTKDNLSYIYSPGTLTADLATARRGGHVQTIGTSAETVSLGDVATPTLGIFRNLDASNFVTIGPQVGTTLLIEPFLKLLAGQVALVWLDPAVVIMAQADTASVDLQVDVFE